MVPVLPVMLQEPGESDLLAKLEEHQLQQKVACDLGQPTDGARWWAYVLRVLCVLPSLGGVHPSSAAI